MGGDILLVDVSREAAAGEGGVTELLYAKHVGSGDKHCCMLVAVFPSKASSISSPTSAGTRPSVGPVGLGVMDW